MCTFWGIECSSSHLIEFDQIMWSCVQILTFSDDIGCNVIKVSNLLNDLQTYIDSLQFCMCDITLHFGDFTSTCLYVANSRVLHHSARFFVNFIFLHWIYKKSLINYRQLNMQDTSASTAALNNLQGSILYSSLTGDGMRLEYPVVLHNFFCFCPCLCAFYFIVGFILKGFA